ncbi:MAG: dynamin family protein [Victivallales bacterium]|nr:dynamin family protein [Victivallales bacterium]MBR4611687.1 dynamin family protein [Kiritimatiellia bacterium]
MITFCPQIDHPRQHGNAGVDEQIETYVRKLCKVRDEVNAQLDTYPQSDGELDGIAEEILRDLHKRILQFQTNKFFVAVFGSLKAGKSTLINALVRRRVSPTGYGQETTLHCSIILKADQEHPEGIYLHRNADLCKEQSKEKRKKMAVALLDYFREMESSDTLAACGIERSRCFDFNGYDLSGKKDNLTAILTEKELGAYPDVLLVEIRLKWPEDDSFLDQLALFDMPGLEGCLANTENDPVLDELRNVADYFIYVQSSVGALSDKAAEYINSIVNKQKKPMVVVFNKIMGKYWLSQGSQREEQENYEKRACELLAERAGIRLPEAYNVNAAQAWNAMDADFDLATLKPEFRTPNATDDDLRGKLWMESGIESMKKNLMNVFCKQIVPIQDKNAKAKFNEWRENTLHPDGKLQQFISKMEKENVQLDAKLSCLMKIMEKTENPTFQHESGRTIYQALDQESFMTKTISDLRAKTIRALEDFKQHLLRKELSSVTYPSGTNVQDKYVQYTNWDSECAELVDDFREDFQKKFRLAGKRMMDETQKAFESVINEMNETVRISDGEKYQEIKGSWLKTLEDTSCFLKELAVPEKYHVSKLQPAVPSLWKFCMKRPKSNTEADDQRQKQDYKGDLEKRLTNLYDAALKELETEFEDCCRKMKNAMNQDLQSEYDSYTAKSNQVKGLLRSAKQLLANLSKLPKGV